MKIIKGVTRFFFFFDRQESNIIKKEIEERIQGVHDNEQKTTHKIEKQRTQKAMLRDNRKSLREE